MRDFFEVMNELGVYDRKCHNKTDNLYTFPNGAAIEFFSADDEQKLRGRKRDICWANEANELLHDDFLQLNLRTTGKVIVDYNPSDSNSWIYELPEEDSITIKSTYRDNPFLDRSIIKQIENLKHKDDALYQIYALGERASSRKNVYSNWNFIGGRPDRFTSYVYGLDFGYNHPTSLVKVWYHDDQIYIDSLIYESYLTATDLVERMEGLGVDQNTEILCDYARPEIIQTLKEAGYYALNAKKSVKEGIDTVKQFEVYLSDSDINLKKEYENYMWKKVGDRILDEPVKQWDDAMDSIRYAVMQIKDELSNSNSPLISF
jgi:phage terminase large subunit